MPYNRLLGPDAAILANAGSLKGPAVASVAINLERLYQAGFMAVACEKGNLLISRCGPCLICIVSEEQVSMGSLSSLVTLYCLTYLLN
jgi:hypothetical protein